MSNENNQMIRISDETHSKLKEYSNTNGYVISRLTDKIIKEYLESVEKKDTPGI